MTTSAHVTPLNPTVARLWSEIETRRYELIEIVADLVRFPSLLGQEAAAQAYVADHLRTSGLAVESWDLPDEVTTLQNGGDSGIPFADRPNVAGIRRGTGGGHSLILNGHIDVVSPEPVSAWTYDPWEATIVGNLMYGRGAYDMKSGVALNLFLSRLLRDLDIQLAADLIVQSVIEEECTGNGALAMASRYPADACIVTEPTSGHFVKAHVGVLWFKIDLTGVSWHAMQAYKGVNAIVKAVPIIQALGVLDRRLNEIPPHPAFADVEHPINLNIGIIQGGDWPSTVPGSCQLHCRLAFYPGQEVADVRAEIERTVHQAAAADSWLSEHPPRISYDGFQSAGSVVSMDEPAVHLLGIWHQRVTGTVLEATVGTGINDMRYFNFAGIPAGCYGARGGNGHAADEWLDLDSLVPTAKVLAATIVDWCGVAES